MDRLEDGLMPHSCPCTPMLGYSGHEYDSQGAMDPEIGNLTDFGLAFGFQS